jgi:hypothetical protein
MNGSTGMIAPAPVEIPVAPRALQPAPNRDVRNAQDTIYANGGRQSTLTIRRTGSGYVAAITMGVRR